MLNSCPMTFSRIIRVLRFSLVTIQLKSGIVHIIAYNNEPTAGLYSVLENDSRFSSKLTYHTELKLVYNLAF